MDSSLSHGTSQADPDTTLQDVRSVVEETVVAALRWYSNRATWPRVVFRSAGTLVILISSALPLLASLDYPGKVLVLSGSGVSIAALSGLSTFFAWDRSWRGRRQSTLALQNLLALWELRLIKARGFADTGQRRAAILDATEALLEQAAAVAGAETEGFFASIKWPRAEPPGTQRTEAQSPRVAG